MIVTVGGTPGSGKSTLAKRLAKRLGVAHYSMGDLQRSIAAEHGWTINELNAKNAAGEFDSDAAVDERQAALGASGEDFVIDGRLSFHFLPRSVKLFLDAAPEVRAARLVKRGSASDRARDAADALRLNTERTAYENERFEQLYGVRPQDPANYDLVLDSTATHADELIARVLKRFPELKKKAL